MKNNNNFFKAIGFLLVFLFVSVDFCLADAIDKAEKLAGLEGYSGEVSQLLKRAIIDDPTDAKVHYRAGKVYQKMGWTGDAETAFRNATRLDQGYGVKIANEYKISILPLLQKNQVKEALRNAQKTMEFNPGSRGEVLNLVLSYSKDQFNKQNSAHLECFKFVYEHDNSQGKNIADFVAVDGTLNNLRLAMEYDSSYGEKLGQKLIALANELEQKDVYNKKIKELRDEATKHIRIKPQEITWGIGKHSIELQPKECSPWIMQAGNGKATTFTKDTSNDFYIMYVDNGEYVDYSKGERIRTKLPNGGIVNKSIKFCSLNEKVTIDFEIEEKK